MTKPVVTDRPAFAFNGYFALIVSLAALLVAGGLGVRELASPLPFSGPDNGRIVLLALLGVAALYSLTGTYSLQPNEAAVVQLFGAYIGTDETPGLRWTIPLFSRTVVSKRLQTQEVGPLKVNDRAGNPIEVGAVVVWRVFDAARAALQVDSYRHFVGSQAETGLRHLAGSYPYDSWSSGTTPATLAAGDESVAAAPSADITALRDGGEALVEELTHQVAQRLAPAGIAVDEARLTHLAYAPEIAQAMLRPQQAAAVIAAREIIAEGAVSIAIEAANTLAKHGVSFDDQEKARMIGNILTVLVSDKDASPVLNIGAHRPS
ncbi:MAG: SPFH domain-containing protein [Pseudochelatococcus sp.]|jgi:regulator of protease activity HflC (stomatin/prohibitin superfamily)|uniref:SPFH domain-containing protein n=1 Tax=Pseudochelatococcus sp. TaxID=2020869 RepID=UPI003D8F0927